MINPRTLAALLSSLPIGCISRFDRIEDWVDRAISVELAPLLMFRWELFKLTFD